MYSELRSASALTGGVPIAVRHIESILRMAEACARMHLRDHVREDDVDMALKVRCYSLARCCCFCVVHRLLCCDWCGQVVLESFLQAQKVSVRKTLQRGFRKYLTYGEASNQLLMHKLQGLVVEVEKYKLVSWSITVS